jgi:hypothetical protein
MVPLDAVKEHSQPEAVTSFTAQAQRIRRAREATDLLLCETADPLLRGSGNAALKLSDAGAQL